MLPLVDASSLYVIFFNGHFCTNLRSHKRNNYKYFRKWGELGGSGSIITTANQMAEWLHTQLNRGMSQSGNTVIEESVLEETHFPVNGLGSTPSYLQRPILPVTYDYARYSLGWRYGFYRGLPMVSHTGSSWGYGALLTLLKDVKIGIYSSITGPDDSVYGRRTAHMYIADLLLGEEPWLNLTTGCSFPEPWQSATSKKGKYDIKHSKDIQAAANLAIYEGTFGNFAYGNITVYINETLNDMLQMRLGEMGLWNLYPSGDGTEHAFTVDGIDIIWPLDSEADFSSKDPDGCPTCMDLLTVYFQSTSPPVFERDLKMADAPPPPATGCLEEDGGPISGTATILPLIVYSFYSVMLSYLAQ